MNDPIRSTAHAKQARSDVAERGAVGVARIGDGAGGIAGRAAGSADQEVGERSDRGVAALDSFENDVPVNVLGLKACPDGVLSVRPGNGIGYLKLIGRVEDIISDSAADVEQALNRNG